MAEATLTQRAVLLRSLGLSYYKIAKIIYNIKDTQKARKAALKVNALLKKFHERAKNSVSENYIQDDGEVIYSSNYIPAPDGGERDRLRHRWPLPHTRVRDKNLMNEHERMRTEYEEFLYEIYRDMNLSDNILWETIRWLHNKSFNDFYERFKLKITRQKYGYFYKRKNIDAAAAYAYVIISLAGMIVGRGMLKELLRKHILENYVKQYSIFEQHVKDVLSIVLPKLI